MLLYVDACLRGAESRTKVLCEQFLYEYAKQNPNDEIETVNVGEAGFSWFDNQAIIEREALISQKKWDDPIFDAAKQFVRADKIVMGAPYWDYSFPAILKCYIENICVNGLTFQYTQKGAEGLCRAEKMLFITTAGGKIASGNSGFTYLEEIFTSLFGIRDCYCIAAEMLDVIGQDVPLLMRQAAWEVSGMVQSF